MAGVYSQVTTGTEFWSSVFGRSGPVEIEIGPGTGAFLLQEAARRPQVNFVAIESSRSRAENLEALVRSRGLTHVRVVHAPAQCVVHHIVPTRSVAAYHIYFPDPWWKRRHHRRRLLTPAFARDVARTLVPGGLVAFATDVDFLWTMAIQCFVGSAGLTLRELAPPFRRSTRTRFEEKGLRRGATIYEGWFELPAEAKVAANAPASISTCGNSSNVGPTEPAQER
jgi:tRNA (guanine-N7-)-methyltransferase